MKQVLEMLWRKGNPSTLLVGMQTGADTLENSMKFPQKNYRWNCLFIQQCFIWDNALRILTYQLKNLCTLMFIVALITVAKY